MRFFENVREYPSLYGHQFLRRDVQVPRASSPLENGRFGVWAQVSGYDSIQERLVSVGRFGDGRQIEACNVQNVDS